MVEVKYPERVALGSAIGGMLGLLIKHEGGTAVGVCIGTIIGMALATDVFERKMLEYKMEEWK